MDLQQRPGRRFAGAFAIQATEFPDGRWYVVNQMLDTDPDSRPAPFAGASDDVEMFAAAGGLVVDTRELFKLVSVVEAGELSPQLARESLRGAAGVFTFVASAPVVGPSSDDAAGDAIDQAVRRASRQVLPGSTESDP